MCCSLDKCLSSHENGLCYSRCMMNLEIIKPEYLRPIQDFLLQYPEGRRRNRIFIQILQELQPPKVTKTEINRWWRYRKSGFDSDCGDIKFNKIKRKRRLEYSIGRITKLWQKANPQQTVQQKTLSKEEYKNLVLAEITQREMIAENFHL